MTLQIATRRAGVPHARSLSRWANAAFSAARAAAPALGGAAITVRIIGRAEGRMLNRTWRGKDKPTNVLSFPAQQAGSFAGSLPDLRRRTASFAGSLPRLRGRAGCRSSASVRSRHSRILRSRGHEPDFLGDLAICAPLVASEAREQGKPARAHWAHLVVHGVLHLIGYDHERERDAALMEACEIEVLAQLGISNPYA